MLVQKFFDTGNVQLNYVTGPVSGPPLVLLHGESGRWQTFEALMPELSKKWRIYAPDFRGHGKSGRLPGQYRLSDYTLDTIRLLEQVVGEPAVLFGHSMGAQVAFMVAAQRPDQVRAVINGDSPISLEQLRQALRSQKMMNQQWRDLAAAGLPVEQITHRLRELPYAVPGEVKLVTLADVLGADSPWFPAMAGNLRDLDPTQLDAVIEFEAMHAGFDAEILFPQIRCPVLMLQADPNQGGLLTDKEILRAKMLLPYMTSVSFPGVGHGLHTQAPELVLQSIQPFLNAFLVS